MPPSSRGDGISCSWTAAKKTPTTGVASEATPATVAGSRESTKSHSAQPRAVAKMARKRDCRGERGREADVPGDDGGDGDERERAPHHLPGGEGEDVVARSGAQAQEEDRARRPDQAGRDGERAREARARAKRGGHEREAGGGEPEGDPPPAGDPLPEQRPGEDREPERHGVGEDGDLAGPPERHGRRLQQGEAGGLQ